MAVRLARKSDLRRLSRMLRDMGQVWHDAAILERMARPEDTVIVQERNRRLVGFCFIHRNGQESIIGPAGGPQETDGEWLLSIAKMGAFATQRRLREEPGFEAGERWLVFKVWPQTGTKRDHFESVFGFRRRTASGAEGWVEDARDGSHTYHIRRQTVVDRIAQLVSLE